MRPVKTRHARLLTLAWITLAATGVGVVLTRANSPHGGHAGLPPAPSGAASGAPGGGPNPGAAAAGASAGGAPRTAAARSAVRRPAPGRAGAPRAPASQGPHGYPGQVNCADPGVPSSAPYAWQCTHADGTPVRWATSTIRVWSSGLTPVQTDALRDAEAQWVRYSGVNLVPATSAADAQLVLREVDSLGALPSLGPNIVEYAYTGYHLVGGYYDRATIDVANLPLLGYPDWLDTFLHELGHVSGLTHVASETEVMRPVVGVPQTTYGSGDIAGLQSERPV